MDYSKALISGFVTRHSMRYLTSGLPVLEFTLAGECTSMATGNEAPFYQPIQVFGSRAKVLQREAPIGTALLIEGNLVQERWVDKAGLQQSVLRVNANAVFKLDQSTDESVDRKGNKRLVNALNRVDVSGVLVREPDTQVTKSGRSVTRVPLLTTTAGPSGKTRRSMFEVMFWDDDAQLASEMRKGDSIAVISRVVNDSWERDGVRRYAIRLEAHEWMFLERFKRRNVTESHVVDGEDAEVLVSEVDDENEVVGDESVG
jgi:single-stranded DNA-binding protein